MSRASAASALTLDTPYRRREGAGDSFSRLSLILSRIMQRGYTMHCKNGGFVRLYLNGERITMPTICKTWSCETCQIALKQRLREMIRYGCSMDEHSYFITLTYRRTSDTVVDAEYVKGTWTAFLRKFRQQEPKLKWFKVVEATKKGTPHLHLIMNGLGKRIPCDSGKDGNGVCAHEWTKRYMQKSCKKDCLEHQIGKLWMEVTGNSYVVDARQMLTAGGAAAYLTKYLTKNFLSWYNLQELGFQRRWSCSRNWPRRPGDKLVVTGLHAWDHVEIVKSWDSEGYSQLMAEVEESKESELIKRVDDSGYLYRREQALKGQVKRLANYWTKGNASIGDTR